MARPKIKASYRVAEGGSEYYLRRSITNKLFSPRAQKEAGLSITFVKNKLCAYLSEKVQMPIDNILISYLNESIGFGVQVRFGEDILFKFILRMKYKDSYFEVNSFSVVVDNVVKDEAERDKLKKAVSSIVIALSTDVNNALLQSYGIASYDDMLSEDVLINHMVDGRTINVITKSSVTYRELFNDFYDMNDRLRYINGQSYAFADHKYEELDLLYYYSTRGNLYYERKLARGGIID
jgi:hypothetical protein|nr:MAG TPA: hypothetical protein [Bacteriophage sp.]DAX40878.1 MAG TPA: hypothetical protein [Caudoviricetes sp.]